MTPKIVNKKERSRNFTEKEKWIFVELFEPHKDILLSVVKTNRSLYRYIWQNIANQINSLESNINEQPWTVVQLQQLWKNLARRAKSRPHKVKELIGCEYDNIEEPFITQLDLKVLNILDSFASSNSQTTSNHTNDFKESSETSNSGEVLDWDNAISVLKTEPNDLLFVQSSVSTSLLDTHPLPVETTLPKPNIIPGEDYPIPKSNHFSSDNSLEIDLLEEKRAILIAERLNVEAKMKQIELKNKRLETEIEANLARSKLINAEIETNAAKKCKYDEEAKMLRLKRLQLMKILKEDGVLSSDANF